MGPFKPLPEVRKNKLVKNARDGRLTNRPAMPLQVGKGNNPVSSHIRLMTSALSAPNVFGV